MKIASFLASHEFKRMRLLFALMAIFLILSVAIIAKRVIAEYRPPQVIASQIGIVQKTNFVGGLSADTQVDLADRAILLLGVANLVHGDLLEQRVAGERERVCVVGTKRCWRAIKDAGSDFHDRKD